MKQATTTALVLLSKALEKELKERTLEPGTHTVAGESLNLTIDGEVLQCEPETYTPTVDIPLKVTLALFVRYSGVTGDAALNALEKAMSEALAIGEKGEESVAEIADINRSMQKVVDMLGELPKKTRKGKRNVKKVKVT